MKIIYCAIPTKELDRQDEIISFVINQGYIPFNPHFAFPKKYFEDGKIGRDKTMEICKQSIYWCNEFWYFGKSKGTDMEMEKAKKLGMPIKILGVFKGE